MKLFDILTQFKNIAPDAHFSERSKREILLSPQSAPRRAHHIFTFFHIAETGVAMALVVFFILILTSSFPATRSLAPIQYAVINPTGLHAEAQAIDMQIQLANIEYPQVASTIEAEDMTASATALNGALASTLALPSSTDATSASTTAATPPASSTATSVLSVDQALQKLSQ